DASAYRDLHREAGLIGQVLYLQAEARGLRGTGIGCFFDDPIHELLGLADDTFQTVYHFTVGLALEDTRIETLPTAIPTSRPTSTLASTFHHPL
ncbi:MAG: nitroreductase family protein, partial [Methylophilaceae bacterium]